VPSFATALALHTRRRLAGANNLPPLDHDNPTIQHHARNPITRSAAGLPGVFGAGSMKREMTDHH
jgi:hypothetical protein